MISQRSRVDARPNRLARALEMRPKARAYLDLTASNPTRVGIPYGGEAILGALATPRALVYEPSSFGLDSARTAVAELWASRGVKTDPSRVLLTSSTSEAYSLLFKLLCDPGEAVLVPAPSYPLFEHLARYEGVVAEPYRLAYDGAWHVDLDHLRDAVTTRSRAVVLVSPNNPTGSFVKREELAVVADLGLPIISDEVFGAYAFGADPKRVASALEAKDIPVFALDGLSKYAALPQMKLAWTTIGGSGPVVEDALTTLEHLADTFLSPGTAVQHALPRLLEVGATSREAIRRRCSANRDALVHGTGGSAVTPLSVEGGWYAVARLPSVMTEEAWVLALLERADVLVQPGWFYDFEEEPFVVLSLLTPESEFAEGLSRLVRLVDQA